MSFSIGMQVINIFQQLWHFQETHMQWGELGLGGHASTQDLKQQGYKGGT
jgi:hypothetical protein